MDTYIWFLVGGESNTTLSANRQIFGFTSADATNDLYDWD
jgi:hypothetical protein